MGSDLSACQPRAGVVTTGLDGVLVLNKPAGWTSHDVVAKVRALLRVRKAGHTGTLDPSATGVLVLCLGKATRIAEYLINSDKTYRAVLRLGVATDTQDATGTVVGRYGGALPDATIIREAMNRFVGHHQQIPPMYSAVKVRGVPLYKSARAGQTVTRPARAVTIRALQILSISPPAPTVGAGGVDVTFDVVCSKGTYIRTLCADIGEALGVGGHLAGLERRQAGRFRLDEALGLDELVELVEHEAVATRLHSMATALADLPALIIDAGAVESILHGVAVPMARVVRIEGQWASGTPVRLQAQDGRLLAIGKATAGPVVAVDKVLA